MDEIELKPTRMHWIVEGDPFRDCCVHGGVYFRLGQTVISDGIDDSWSISTAAFNFLRTLFTDHKLGYGEPLVPHCGFTMWPVAFEPDGLYMPNCDLSINWSILHKGDQLVHEFQNGTICETSLIAWSKAVSQFADEVYEFFHTAWPKIIDEEEGRAGFELFMKLWRERRAAADSLYAGPRDS